MIGKAAISESQTIMVTLFPCFLGKNQGSCVNRLLDSWAVTYDGALREKMFL